MSSCFGETRQEARIFSTILKVLLPRFSLIKHVPDMYAEWMLSVVLKGCVTPGKKERMQMYEKGGDV
jgi:hypothetical protein